MLCFKGGLNPLKRVNSILTGISFCIDSEWVTESQSPQTGQFNSYSIYYYLSRERIYSLNPLKRVNSILTNTMEYLFVSIANVSIPSNGSIQFLHTLRAMKLRE